MSVNKAARRLLLGDFRSPTDGNAMHPDAVVNERAGTHFNHAGGEHRKFHPRWSQGVEVARITKKGKHIVAWTRQPYLGAQGEFFAWKS